MEKLDFIMDYVEEKAIEREEVEHTDTTHTDYSDSSCSMW